ncbi:MAG: hypothetical protein V9H26_06835 [Verrucomicrobiota bacterium]
MKCPNCKKSLWFVRSFCPFCSTNINVLPRPKSVTVLCWCLIGSGISLVFLSFVDTELQSYLERLGSVHPAQRVFFFVGPCRALFWADSPFLATTGPLVPGSVAWRKRAD